MSNLRDDIFESIDRLLSNPQVILDSLRFIDQKMLADPPAFYNLNQLVEIINLDPVLVFKILGRANSRLFHSINEITDIKVAINTLGPIEVRNMFYEQLGAHYIEYLNEKSTCLGVAQNLFSNQVTGSAKTAEKTIKYLINRNSPYSSQLAPFKYVIYYISLLQEIGMIILDQYDHSRYQSLLQQSQGNVDLLIELESASYQGMNHMEVGAEALERWCYAGFFVEMARNHHQLHHQGAGMNQILKDIITYSNNIFYYRNPEIFKENTPGHLTILPESEILAGLQKFSAHPLDESLFEVIDNFKYEPPIPPAT